MSYAITTVDLPGVWVRNFADGQLAIESAGRLEFLGFVPPEDQPWLFAEQPFYMTGTPGSLQAGPAETARRLMRAPAIHIGQAALGGLAKPLLTQ